MAAPKSILKVKDTPEGSILTSATKSKEDRNRDLALHHATLIQDQKDAESEVFNAMMTIISLPSSTSATPELPTATDAKTFTKNVKLFRPADFDELIVERHANGKCGYALCPRPFKKQSTFSRFRIVNKANANDMKIVSTEALEQWCSEACARRGMYVKVQLSDEPSWLRSSNPKIEIMSEKGHTLPIRQKKAPDDDDEEEKDLATGVERLRVERDDKPTSIRPQQVLSSSVLERPTTQPAAEPRLEDDASDMIEGYQSRANGNGRASGTQSDDSDEDNDWEI